MVVRTERYGLASVHASDLCGGERILGSDRVLGKSPVCATCRVA